MLKVSKMKSIVRFLAVPSILSFAKSILWSEFLEEVGNVCVFTFFGAGVVFVHSSTFIRDLFFTFFTVLDFTFY